MNMLDYQLLPSEDHIVRYCNPKLKTESGRVSEAAFELREIDLRKKPSYLSVNWIEYYQSFAEAFEEIKKIWIEKKLNKPGSQIALLNVGHTINYVRDASISDGSIRKCIDLIIKKTDSNDKNPSHSGIFGYEEFNKQVAILINKSVQEYIPINF